MNVPLTCPLCLKPTILRYFNIFNCYSCEEHKQSLFSGTSKNNIVKTFSFLFDELRISVDRKGSLKLERFFVDENRFEKICELKTDEAKNIDPFKINLIRLLIIDLLNASFYL